MTRLKKTFYSGVLNWEKLVVEVYTAWAKRCTVEVSFGKKKSFTVDCIGELIDVLFRFHSAYLTQLLRWFLQKTEVCQTLVFP